MSKSKPLKKISKYKYYMLFISMDNIVKSLKHPKILRYWKRKCLKNIKYNDYMKLHLGQRIVFLEQHCCIDSIYSVFYSCINMSMDNDVQEYLNTLEAIENNIRSSER